MRRAGLATPGETRQHGAPPPTGGLDDQPGISDARVVHDTDPVGRPDGTPVRVQRATVTTTGALLFP